MSFFLDKTFSPKVSHETELRRTFKDKVFDSTYFIFLSWTNQYPSNNSDVFWAECFAWWWHILSNFASTKSIPTWLHKILFLWLIKIQIAKLRQIFYYLNLITKLLDLIDYVKITATSHRREADKWTFVIIFFLPWISLTWKCFNKYPSMITIYKG